MTTNKRKSISKKSRFEIFKRDSFECQYCGKAPPQTILHIDHICPVSGGGDNSEDNLVTSCIECNQGKGARLLSAIPESLKEKAKKVKEAEEQLKEYTKIFKDKRDRIEEQAWDIAELLVGKGNDIRKNKFASIERFLKMLPYHDVYDSMEIATARINNEFYAFKYFCGICWNRIKGGDNET